MSLKTNNKKMKYGLAVIALSAGLAITPNCVSLASSTSSNAGINSQTIEQTVGYTKSERKCKCIPHYLEGVKSPADPLENMIEKARVYKSMEAKYPHKTTKPPINGSIEVRKKIKGEEVVLIFPNYVRQKDGKVRHYHAAGMDTYSAKEFQCVVRDQTEYLNRAAKLDMKDYIKMFDKVIEAQDKELKEKGALKKNQNLKDLLDKNVSDYLPGYKGLKIKDILHTPDLTIQDFIPTRYYFGDFEALGVNYTDSGIVAINPKARVFDYITGVPITLMHEMTHRNQKLQHSPLMYKLDAELWASLPELPHEDLMHFLHHPYVKDIRKVAKICFNFDSKLAEVDITYLDTIMGKEFDEKKVREYINKVDKIRKAVVDVAFNEYLTEFFTHPDHYMAFNDILKDKNATFKLIMYMNYHPTLLGGPEKTRDFVMENEEFSKKLAREVIWDLKSKRSSLENDNSFREIKNTLEERLRQMHPAKKRALFQTVRKFGVSPANINEEEVIKFGLGLYRLGIVDFDEEAQEVKFEW
jgi:nicotinamide mononucleotide adenylyltransferase